MLRKDDAILIVIDVQGKLSDLMFEKELFLQNLSRMIRGAQVMGVPIIWMEQNPLGLGPTRPEIAGLLESCSKKIVKNSFSCWGEPVFRDTLAAFGRKEVLLTGIETHICVYQTARDLLREGYAIHVVTDAVSSRKMSNRDLGIRRMVELGAARTGTEMALFELLGVAEGDVFRQILKNIR